MKTVIIVDPDDLSRRRQTNVAAQLRCQVLGAPDLVAIPREQLEAPDTVLVAAAALGADELLRLIAKPEVRAALIVVSPREGRTDQRLRRFARLLQFRWHAEELARALAEAWREPDDSASLTLVDLLRDLHGDRTTARIAIDSVPTGEILIVAGELVHAERAPLQGLAALMDILADPRGCARVRPIHSIPQTITGDFQSTLLGILEQLDNVNEAP